MHRIVLTDKHDKWISKQECSRQTDENGMDFTLLLFELFINANIVMLLLVE